jgi:hypothetical protein
MSKLSCNNCHFVTVFFEKYSQARRRNVFSGQSGCSLLVMRFSRLSLLVWHKLSNSEWANMAFRRVLEYKGDGAKIPVPDFMSSLLVERIAFLGISGAEIGAAFPGVAVTEPDVEVSGNA